MGAQGQTLQDADGRIRQDADGRMMLLNASGECPECCDETGEGPGDCCESPQIGYYDMFGGRHEQEVSISLSFTETTEDWKSFDGVTLSTNAALTTTVSMGLDGTDIRDDCAGIQTEQRVNRVSGGWVDPAAYLPSGPDATVSVTAASVSNSPADKWNATIFHSDTGPLNYPGTGEFLLESTWRTSTTTGPGGYTYTQSGFVNSKVLATFTLSGRWAYSSKDATGETPIAAGFACLFAVDDAGKVAMRVTTAEALYSGATITGTATCSASFSGDALIGVSISFSFEIDPPVNTDTGEDDLATVSGSGTLTASTNMLGCDTYSAMRGAGCEGCGGDGGEDPGEPE